MNSYEANYKKQFNGFDGVSPGCNHKIHVTARQKLADLIDGSWKHSWHWPVDHNDWLDAVRASLETEMSYANERLKQLRYAQQILSSIDKDEVEEPDDNHPKPISER